MATIITGPVTLEEFLQLTRGFEQHEMSAGELITMPPPKSLHSRVARKVSLAIEAILQKSGFGEALQEAGYILSHDPLTIRQPDVSVLSKTRIQSADPESYFEGAPELAVEVVSPSDSAEDLELKVRQYLQSGARQVWIVYPKSKCVHVFSGGDVIILHESQMLEGEDLLPGFAVKVADLFPSENHASA